MSRLLLAAIRAYRLVIGSWLAPSCRFAPTCTAYAAEAIQSHGAGRGSWLALRRLARCHPWNAGGHDPVPPATSHDRCDCTHGA